MRRCGALGLGMLLMVCCAPVTEVPTPIQDRVNEVLRGVDPDAAMDFRGRTCESRWRVRLRPYSWQGSAEIDGRPHEILTRLRTVGHQAGWQAYALPSPTNIPRLALIRGVGADQDATDDPATVALALTATPSRSGVTVTLASDTDCDRASPGESPIDIAMTYRPLWTKNQRTVLALGLATGHAAISATVGPAPFPARSAWRSPWEHGVGIHPCTAGSGRSGLQWATTALPADFPRLVPGTQADFPRIIDTLRETAGVGWTSTVTEGALDGSDRDVHFTLSPPDQTPGSPRLHLGLTLDDEGIHAHHPVLRLDGSMTTTCVRPTISPSK